MAFRPSGISVSIRQDLTEGSGRSGTTLNIDPIITKDGRRVTMADIGDIGFAKLDQGTDSEEIISFTNLTDNTSTYQLSGCIWGYNFYDTTNGVSANQKRHISGGTFIITNDDHFLSTQYVNTDDNQTVAGVKTFSSFPVTPSLAPTTNYQVANKKYADDLAIAGAPDSDTTTKGILETATSAETQAGTDTGGTGANLTALPSDIAANVQNAVYSYFADAEASDTYVITPTPAISAYAEGQVFYFKANTVNTGASTLNVNAKGALAILKNGDEALEDGDIKAGAIITVIHDGTQFQMQTQQSSMPTTALLEESATFFGATGITGADAETLSSAATSDAATLHYHSGNMSTGQTTRTEAAGTGTQAITHGLGVVPSYIQIWATAKTANSGANINISTSYGTATGIGDETATWSAIQIVSVTGNVGQDSTHIISLKSADSIVTASATLSAVSATTFTLNWDINLTNNGDTRQIQWTAWK